MIASVVARVRRRAGSVAVLLVALVLTGGLYTAFAPASAADDQAIDQIAVREGEALFNQGCVTCHGRNLQGVDGRGPSLIGTGAAAVEFQVGTGRMPLAVQGAQADRKPPRYTPEQIDQLAAYVQSVGGGPVVPGGDLRDGDLVLGGELFRLNCAQCHAFGGGGGALSGGKYAPSLELATDRQVYSAMQHGPESMPRFTDAQLTPEEKRAIVNYVQTQKLDQDTGGFSIGRLGPVTEGLVIFLVGIVGLLFAALWIAGKQS